MSSGKIQVALPSSKESSSFNMREGQPSSKYGSLAVERHDIFLTKVCCSFISGISVEKHIDYFIQRKKRTSQGGCYKQLTAAKKESVLRWCVVAWESKLSL